jgi:hypothetical protein
MALRFSCLIHGVMLLLVSGCSGHRPVAISVLPDAGVSDDKEYVLAIADKMPMWDADAISRYEQREIATVKADIAIAEQDDGKGVFLADVTKLHDDWDALVALDERLKKESLL